MKVIHPVSFDIASNGLMIFDEAWTWQFAYHVSGWVNWAGALCMKSWIRKHPCAIWFGIKKAYIVVSPLG